MARYPAAQVSEEQALEALEKSRGKLAPAARKLGISDTWLSRFLRDLGYVHTVKWEKR